MSEPDTASPDHILDAIRDHAEWDDRDRSEQFDRLVARFDPEQLAAVARARLHDLSGYDGEAVLHLLDALDEPELWHELARAMLAQPGLPADRAWAALQLLQESGLLEEYPELAERCLDLSELVDDPGSIEELEAQIEQDADGVWLALQGMSSVEPAVRAAIISELADRPLGPGLIELLRLLAHAQDPATRTAALDALATGQPISEPALAGAWASLAADHLDPEIRARASRMLTTKSPGVPALPRDESRLAPRITRSWITEVDGRGQGTIVLVAERDGEYTASAFLCDVERGVPEVLGQIGSAPDSCESLFEEVAGADRDATESAPGPALGLLAGCLLFCDHRTPPVLRFWLERTAGPGFRSGRIAEILPRGVPAVAARAEMASHAKRVLGLCPSWVDASPLARELGEELAVRYGAVPPDPVRDEALYRHLFEHRLQPRLELYRRMLSWMAIFWTAAGDEPSAQSALTLAWHLADPENAVPSHPFIVELTTASLLAARGNRSKDAPGS